VGRAFQSFFIALAISQGDLSIFVTRPLSLSLLLTALIALLIPYLPVLFNLLTGKQIRSGRIVFGQGEED